MSVFLNDKINNFIFLDEISSTNSFAIELLSKNKPSQDYVIYSFNQTEGKGQIGRKWFGGTGKNLSLSVLCHFEGMHISWLSYLNMWTALTLKTFLQEKIKDKNVSVKWPNDIYIQNKKICGILIQSQISGKFIKNVILGLGININQEVFPDWIPNPSSVKLETGIDSELTVILHEIITHLHAKSKGLSFANFENIHQQYNECLYLRDEEHLFFDENKNLKISGKIVKVDEQGRLVIRSEDSILKYKFQEIRYQ